MAGVYPSPLPPSYHPPHALPSPLEDLTKYVRVNRITDLQEDEAGFGGSADVLRGLYHRKDGTIIKVAIKRVRLNGAQKLDLEYRQKAQMKLTRELEIWRSLGQGKHVVGLLGVVMGLGPLLSPVCELCAWNLQAYLRRKSPPPKHMKMMADTLQGLKYMHELQPEPIAHGDIKSLNILVTEDEKAVICDFGRSRLPADQPSEELKSSPFGTTLRYTSPEIFNKAVVGPTPASDMWAYGCVSLEILCRLEPYHEVDNEFRVVELIQQGFPPSQRPRGPHGTLVNDILWATLESCWRPQQQRPTSRIFLDRLTQMLKNGEISMSPAFVDLFPITMDGPPVPWPERLLDLAGTIHIDPNGEMLASSSRANIWIGTLREDKQSTTEATVVIKVVRLATNSGHEELHRQVQQVIRKVIQHRFGVKHRNIVDILGIHSEFLPHPGIVLEYCANRDLVMYCKTHKIDADATARLRGLANAYSLMLDALEGLNYMHSFPIPIPQGDLTPENILVDSSGIAKIASFGRMGSTLPSATAFSTSLGPLLPFRWISPELLANKIKPTTESDMWSMGCVAFWILTGLRPYAGHLRDESAGQESVQGLPPGSIANIDYAGSLGGRMTIPRESTWITNGIWGVISRCWILDPLLRPDAAGFLQTLKELEGKTQNWLPIDVKDLAGKVKRVYNSNYEVWIATYDTFWKQALGFKRYTNHYVRMDLLRSTYSAGWFSKTVPVAVKQPENLFHQPESIRHFKTEAYLASIRNEVAITAQLDHPNICKLLGIDSSNPGAPAMVFEYHSDLTLEKLLGERKPHFTEGLVIIEGLLSALEYMHGHQNGTVVHGDICAHNVYLTDDGLAKLSNFTSACQYVANEAEGRNTPFSSVVSGTSGPTRWKSPEFYLNKGREDIPRPTVPSDLWSFGCLVMNILAGAPPYASANDAVAVAQMNAGVAPFSSEQYSEIDERTLALLKPLLSLDPAERPLAGQLLKELHSI